MKKDFVLVFGNGCIYSCRPDIDTQLKVSLEFGTKFSSRLLSNNTKKKKKKTITPPLVFHKKEITSSSASFFSLGATLSASSPNRSLHPFKSDATATTLSTPRKVEDSVHT